MTNSLKKILNSMGFSLPKKIKVAGQPKLELKSYGEGKDLNYTL